MAKAFLTEIMGGPSAPTPELGINVQIVGLSAYYGDPSGNHVQPSGGPAFQHFVGWDIAYRNHIVQTQPIPSRVPSDAKVLFATERIRITGITGNPVGKTFVLYPVLRQVEPDLDGITFEEYKTGSDWAQFGGANDGSDLASTPFGSLVWTTARANALGAGEVVYLDYTVTSRLQEWLDAGELPTYMLYEVASSVVDATLRVSQPVSEVSAPHTHGVLGYLYALQGYHANADGSINLGAIIDPLSNSTDDHIFMGAVNRNSASAWSKGKVWYSNTRDTARQCVFVDSGRAMPGGVDSSDAASAWLRCVRVYNNSSGAGTGTYKGTWILEVSATDEVDVSFLSADPGAVVEVIATGLDMTADITVTDDGHDRLFIPVEAWNGSATVGDIFRVDTRADLHPTNASALSALEDIVIAYAGGVGTNTPDEDHKRPALTAITQQLAGRDVSAILNSTGPVTGVIATVSDGGSWTHVKVADPVQFQTDQWATLTTALDERDGGRKVEVWVEAVYPLDDPDYPGQVRLSTSAVSAVPVTDPEDFDQNSLLTTGLALGTFTRPDATALAANASTGSSSLVFERALESTGSVQLEIFDFLNARTETLTVTLAGAGGTITSGSTHPAYNYPAGSLVQVVESTSRHPFFVSARPELDTDLGRKRSFVVVDEWALVV